MELSAEEHKSPDGIETPGLTLERSLFTGRLPGTIKKSTYQTHQTSIQTP